MSFPQTEEEQLFFNKLVKEGKIPAKTNMKAFLERLHNGIHIPDDDDAELITRFEMQQFCPDILITNYSMLEYMLLRPREAKIWIDTKQLLEAKKDNKLLFIIDEAHMYRGSYGGEVALLIRRLFHKLCIGRDRVQFILTTASMPDSSQEVRGKVMTFARDLTSASDDVRFCYLRGEREDYRRENLYNIPIEKFKTACAEEFETEESRLGALNIFWGSLGGVGGSFENLTDAYEWMFNNIISYAPFNKLIQSCRGTAVSLQELATSIFPETDQETALYAVSILLAIAPLAQDRKGSVLFPARMHMLFKGIKGVYACTNENCSSSHTDGTMSLGEVFLSDSQLICPHCNSVVYELYNDRRCGALFFKGYILEDDIGSRNHAYFWRYPGQLLDQRMKEVHLYIPEVDYVLPKKKGINPIKPCYLDIKSGFINFKDDSSEGKPNIRKLYYCNYSAKGRPQVITFPTCPHCRHQLSQAQLTSFSTRGNQSFFNLIKSQFQFQPSVPGKDKDPLHYPNEGRKVLLFSDSRQRAARLAKDMSDASDFNAARQLFALAINTMEHSTTQYSLNEIYDYFCLAAAQKHIQIFHDSEREKFANDCEIVLNNYKRSIKRGREYSPRFSITNAPIQMQAYLLRLFSGGYNTLYDSATSWLEPTDIAMIDAIEMLDESGYGVSEEQFVEVFNAWVMSICDTATALGHTIPDTVRLDVRLNFGGYGLNKNWSFIKTIKEICDWKDDSKEVQAWVDTLRINFLDSAQPDNGKLYIDLSGCKL
jgi:hypothetical protein